MLYCTCTQRQEIFCLSKDQILADKNDDKIEKDKNGSSGLEIKSHFYFIRMCANKMKTIHKMI